MTPHKKQRLIFIVFSVLSIGIGISFFLFFFRDNLVYFYGPSELPSTLNKEQLIRIGGLVEKGSLQHFDHPIGVRFRVTDQLAALDVEYQGALPDLFREGQGVVAEGYLISPSLFKANKVLAKHDENYMPPEVQHSLDAASKQALQQSLQKP